MSRFKQAYSVAVGLIGLGGLAAPAFADPMIYVDDVAVPLFEETTITGTVDLIVPNNVSFSNVITGQIVLTVNPGTTADPSTEYTLPVWCIDLFHDIGIGGSGYQYSEGTLSTASTDNSTAANPTALTATQVSEISDLVAYGDYLLSQSSTDNDLNSALVQSAIWTVEYNNPSGNYGANTLTVTGAGINAISIGDLITAAESYGGTAGQLDGLAGVQGQVYETPAPLIGKGLPSLLAIGGVLFGINLMGRSRKRRLLTNAVPHPAG